MLTLILTLTVTPLTSLACDGRGAVLAAATAPLDAGYPAAGAAPSRPCTRVTARDARKQARALEAQIWW